MATIVEFKAHTRHTEARTRASEAGAFQLLFFTGVRYEHFEAVPNSEQSNVEVAKPRKSIEPKVLLKA